MSDIPDRHVLRFFAIGAILACGYCADALWIWCAFAWLVVATGLVLWSFEP